MSVLSARPGRSATARVLGVNAASQVVVMGVSGALAIVTTRLILGNFGIEAYAQYGLLASLVSLVPFADMGMAAAVMNVVSSSSSPRTDDGVRRTLLSAFRILLASACAFVLLGLVLTLTGLWPAVLGGSLLPGSGWVAFGCVLVFSLTLPLGVGQRILTGLGKNHLQIRLQALAAPFILASVLTLVTLRADAGREVALLSYLAGLIVAGASTLLAARLIGPQLRAAVRDVPRVRSVPGARVLPTAGPMLVQLLALPIALQSDRLLISHLAPTSELAQYNLAAQLFGLVIQTIGAAGIALWPVFARARAEQRLTSPFPLVAAFAAGGVVLAGGLAALVPWVVPVVSGGRIQLDGWLVLGFVAFATVQAAKYPLSMYMTDARGLRFQVVPILVMLPVNLGLSWVLVAPLGAAGPVIASAVTVLVFQLLPSSWYVWQDLAARRALALPGRGGGDR